MKSRYTDGFSTHDRTFLDKVYYALLGREITNRGCNDCYRDAYIEIKFKLKKDKAMPKKPDYRLKAGAVISFFGHSKAYTSANLTNEVAEKYLAMNPANANLFAEMPDDWKARVAAYVEHNADGSDNAPHMTEAEALEIIKSKDAQIAEKNSLIAELQSQLTAHSLDTPSVEEGTSEKDLEIENLRMELGNANEQLAATIEERDNLRKEVENLKKENKGLKQSNAMLKKKADTEATAEPNAE